MATLLNSFVGGIGFMGGVLAIYTAYDFCAERIARHIEGKARKGRKRRRK